MNFLKLIIFTSILSFSEAKAEDLPFNRLNCFSLNSAEVFIIDINDQSVDIDYGSSIGSLRGHWYVYVNEHHDGTRNYRARFLTIKGESRTFGRDGQPTTNFNLEIKLRPLYSTSFGRFSLSNNRVTSEGKIRCTLYNE